MSSETEYLVNFSTAQGWEMAQDRYNQLSFWQRLLKKPLADVFIKNSNPGRSVIRFKKR